jgi:acetylornithine deacetylase
MNAVSETVAKPARVSPAARAMIERLIAFKTVSRDSNLGLIEWVRDYLHGHGAKTRLTHDATGKKANLFATLGESAKPGLILSGHTDVVPVDGQNWDTDPFVAVERGRQAVRARLCRHEGVHRHHPQPSTEIRRRSQ